MTVEGSGHMVMGETLGAAPYEITITEEEDAPITAEDVGAIPLPDNPKKGQTLIFDGSKWIPGDTMGNLPVASASVLGGIKVGSSLEISEDGVLDCNTSYINVKTTKGSVASGTEEELCEFYYLAGGYYQFLAFNFYVKNFGAGASTFSVALGEKSYGKTTIMTESTSPGGQKKFGFSAMVCDLVDRYKVPTETAFEMGSAFFLSAGGASFDYEITTVAFGKPI